jgi:hypothetical protein
MEKSVRVSIKKIAKGIVREHAFEATFDMVMESVRAYELKATEEEVFEVIEKYYPLLIDSRGY